jgi:hypothetical protein
MQSRNKYDASQPPIWVEKTRMAEEVQAATKDVRLASSPKSARGEPFNPVRYEYYHTDETDHHHHRHHPSAAPPAADTQKNIDFDFDEVEEDNAADGTQDTNGESTDGESLSVGGLQSDLQDDCDVVMPEPQAINPAMKLSMPQSLNQREQHRLTSPSGGRRVKRVIVTSKRPVDWPRYVPSKQTVENKRSQRSDEMCQLKHERDVEILKRSQEVLLEGVGQVSTASRASLQSRREERLQDALYRGEQWAISEAGRRVSSGPELF